MKKTLQKSKKFITVLIITIIATCLTQVFCSTIVSAAVKLNKTKVTLCKGQTYQLKITGTKSKAKWKTSNKKNVSVSSTGKIKAIKASTTKITATVGKKKYYCTVKVEAPKLSKTSIKTNPGKKYTLKIGKTTQKIKWSSSNKNIVTVSGAKYNKSNKYGTVSVTVKGTGTAYVRAKVGSKTFKCKFSSIKATGVSLVKVEKELHSKYSVALRIKNNNSYAVAFMVKIKLLDANKKVLKEIDTATECLGAGKTGWFVAGSGILNNASQKIKEYASIKTEIQNFKKSNYIDRSSDVTVTKEGTDFYDASIPKIKFVSNKYLSEGANAIVLFFDKNSNFLCASCASSSRDFNRDNVKGATDIGYISAGTTPHKNGVNLGIIPESEEYDSSKTVVKLHSAYSTK